MTRHLNKLGERTPAVSSGSFEHRVERYAVGVPSAQAVLDLFDGEWSSAMPPDSSLVTRPGHAALFDDARIHWAAGRLGGFQGRTVLELGPLEGAHSYMLQRLGASSVAAIEANTRAFLRCLCVKEIFGLDRVCFELGDFVSYMEEDKHSFDIVIACGVLYHMRDPIRVLELVAQRDGSSISVDSLLRPRSDCGTARHPFKVRTDGIFPTWR